MRSRSSEPASPEQLYQYALRLLTGRDYSASRLATKLASRGVAADVAAVIERLQNERLLDDRRYAARFAEMALASGRYYGARLKIEMRRRGFAAEVIGEALAPLLLERDESAEIRGVLERRFPGFSWREADERDKRRAIGFLQRRGFSVAAIMRVLRLPVEEL